MRSMAQSWVVVLAIASGVLAQLPTSQPGTVVLGLDLTGKPTVQNGPKGAPEIFEPHPDYPGSVRERSDVLMMPLTELAWLRYSTSRQHFYVEVKRNPNSSDGAITYGPIDGDPFEMMPIEQMMTARLVRLERAPDDPYRIDIMLRTGDNRLAIRAVRMLKATLAIPREVQNKDLTLRELRPIIEKHAATMTRLGLGTELGHLNEALAAMQADVDSNVMEVPLDQYTVAKDVTPAPPTTIPAEAWSEPLNGLRAAAIPVALTTKLGATLRFDIIVENVGKTDIKFSTMGLLQSARAEVTGPGGKPITTSTAFFSGFERTTRYLLKPGERIVLGSPTLTFNERRDPQRQASYGDSLVIAPAGEYQVRYNPIGISSGQSWSRDSNGVMKRSVPAKGEWSGMLGTGFVKIQVGN